MNRKVIVSLIALAMGFTLLASSDIEAGEEGSVVPVAVIVNKQNSVDQLSVNDLRKIYSNNVLHWPDGTPIKIYDLILHSPVRFTFSQIVLGRPPSSVAEEWAHLKITNQAKNPPLTMKSERLIMKRVSMEKGAIGYVRLELVKGNESVRVIATLN